MPIHQVAVSRDNEGMWTHPDFLCWDEGTSESDIKAWFNLQNITYYLEKFEDTADEELIDKWFESGVADCRAWTPSCTTKGAFLLSIHDTEEGPVALFAIPNEEKTHV